MKHRKLLGTVFLMTLILVIAGCTEAPAAGETVLTQPSFQQLETTFPAMPEHTQTAPYYGFRVEGGVLLDANGKEFVIRGINHPHIWFPEEDETALAAIAQTGSNTVRIVCGAGIRYTKDTVRSLSQVISLCRQHRMIAVLEIHDITGENDIPSLDAVVDFWVEMKDALIGQEAYVIVNIANEWQRITSSKYWFDAYAPAIARLREEGIRNTVMVDCPSGGQYARCIADYGQRLLEADPEKNVMFSVHMYGISGADRQSVQRNLEYATQRELCVVVGEFGHCHDGKDIDEAFIMEYCTKYSIGYLGWSWKGNNSEAAQLDIALEWDGSRLSEDWGELLVNGPNGIRATSQICSIYGGEMNG